LQKAEVNSENRYDTFSVSEGPPWARGGSPP